MNASRKYYVSTIVRYVLVDAANETEARAKGEAELNAQYDAEGFKGSDTKPIALNTSVQRAYSRHAISWQGLIRPKR